MCLSNRVLSDLYVYKTESWDGLPSSLKEAVRLVLHRCGGECCFCRTSNEDMFSNVWSGESKYLTPGLSGHHSQTSKSSREQHIKNILLLSLRLQQKEMLSASGGDLRVHALQLTCPTLKPAAKKTFLQGHQGSEASCEAHAWEPFCYIMVQGLSPLPTQPSTKIPHRHFFLYNWCHEQFAI